MFDLNKFLKERTLTEKIIYLIGAILLVLLGWLSRNFPFSTFLTAIVENISKLYLVVLNIFLLLSCLAILLYASQISKQLKPEKILFKKYTINKVEITLRYKNPKLSENFPSEISSQSEGRYKCLSSCKEPIISHGEGWNCGCQTFSGEEISNILQQARIQLEEDIYILCK